MSFSVTEIDVWPRLRRAIEEKKGEIQIGFVNATNWETVRRLQEQWAILDWILGEARGKWVTEDEE